MLFNHVAFHDRSRFQIQKTQRVFTLVRSPFTTVCENLSILGFQFYEGSAYAGSAAVFGKPFDPVTRNRPMYALYQIFLNNKYQFLSLGSLLIYIINTEVRVNGGEYLYLIDPVCSALGFYLRLGFMPDPDEVREKDDLTGLSAFSASPIPFFRNHYLNEHLWLSRIYSRWRCCTETLNMTLIESVGKKFKYLQPV
ncbi:hypothetical protein [Candidatus Sororendozoicomonas aggregata]|uniref:hypothetical protein n=1 Tax=Candidatus Sororendozoicomonas aggregata TaxID=3073239 RepID=UPI002ED2E028